MVIRPVPFELGPEFQQALLPASGNELLKRFGYSGRFGLLAAHLKCSLDETGVKR
ncbi:MAG TPA: hypothetical protein VIE42_03955 [Steroidobacteraceae bacterium]